MLHLGIVILDAHGPEEGPYDRIITPRKELSLVVHCDGALGSFSLYPQIHQLKAVLAAADS